MYMDLSELYITLGKQGSNEKFHLERAESYRTFFTHNQNAACIIKKGNKKFLNYKHYLHRVLVPVFITIFPLITPYIRMLSSEWLMRGVFFFTNSYFFQLFRHCRGICLIITLHRDACNKICKTLSVVCFIAKSY